MSSNNNSDTQQQLSKQEMLAYLENLKTFYLLIAEYGEQQLRIMEQDNKDVEDIRKMVALNAAEPEEQNEEGQIKEKQGNN